MDLGPLETYHHREVIDLGVWEREAIKLRSTAFLLQTN